MKRKLGLAVGIFLTFIVVVSVFFHHPVQIIDALTLKPAPGFDVQINPWRVVFEPFLGHIMFFNRGLYAIDEMLLSVWWVVIAFVVYTLVKLFGKKTGDEKKKFLLSQLVNLPIVIGLWFTYFLITIFVSTYFPSNTIVNKNEDTILVTTHSHSEFSHDGLISQEGLWKWHKYNNFDAFFITDHNNHGKTLDFVNAQRKGEFASEPLVMGGEEFGGTNHMSLLGLKSYEKTKGLSDSAALAMVRADGGAVIINHWFDGENMSLEYYRDLGIDGFEIENTATNTSYDREVYGRIRKFCEENGLIMNGGLDFHGYGNVCTVWNAMEIPGWHKLSQDAKEAAILDVIKSRDQGKLKVLLYSDRPYYKEKNLFLMVFVHVFNYFRTLNFWQILSWAVWALLFVFVKVKISECKKEKRIFKTNNLIALTGVAGSLFMLALGMVYYLRTFRVAGSDNDIYIEYAELLFYFGGAFLIYAGIVTWFRFKKQNTGN